MSDDIRVTPWPGPEPISEAAILARLRDEGLLPYDWGNLPGDVYAPHTHRYDKVLYVVSGSITFSFMDREPLTLRKGDRLDLPAGVVHSAVVGREGVICVEGYRI